MLQRVLKFFDGLLGIYIFMGFLLIALIALKFLITTPYLLPTILLLGPLVALFIFIIRKQS